jgi:hypothetical protein
VWAKSLGGIGWDIANTMTVTPNNDVIIAGSFEDRIAIEDSSFYPKGFSDVYVATYTSEGEFVNAYTLGGKGFEFPIMSEYFGSYHILVVKYYNSFTINDSKINAIGSTNFLIGYFSDKGELIHQQIIGGSNDVHVTGMDVDENGTVYVIGHYNGKLHINGQVYSADSLSNGFVATFALESKSAGFYEFSKDQDVLFTCCRLIDNRLSIVGELVNSTEKTLFTTTLLSNGKYENFRTYFHGPEFSPTSLIKIKNSILIAAQYKYYCTDGKTTLQSKGQSDIVMIKIDDKWKTTPEYWSIGGYGADIPNNLSSSGEMAVLVGSFGDDLDLGNGELDCNKMGSDVFMLFYGEEKIPEASISLGGRSNDFPCKVVTNEEEVYVLGQFKEQITLSNDTVVTTKGSYDVFLMRFENCGAKQLEIIAKANYNTDGVKEYTLSVSDKYDFYDWSNLPGNGNEVSTTIANNYTVNAIDRIGCTSSASIDSLTLTKITIAAIKTYLNADQTNFKLFPTCVDNIVFWQPGSNFPTNGATLNVYDAVGNLILTEECGRGITSSEIQTLHIGQLVPGPYFVCITGEGFKVSGKVIVNR